MAYQIYLSLLRIWRWKLGRRPSSSARWTWRAWSPTWSGTNRTIMVSLSYWKPPALFVQMWSEPKYSYPDWLSLLQLWQVLIWYFACQRVWYCWGRAQTPGTRTATWSTVWTRRTPASTPAWPATSWARPSTPHTWRSTTPTSQAGGQPSTPQKTVN